MKKTEDTIERRKKRAIQALLTYPTIDEAARAARLPREIVSAFLADAEFREAFNRAVAEVDLETMLCRHQAERLAVGRLRDILADPRAPSRMLKSAIEVALSSKTRLDPAAMAKTLQPETSSDRRVRHMVAQGLDMMILKAARMGLQLSPELQRIDDAVKASIEKEDDARAATFDKKDRKN